ncbi:uncharacterized protein LOC132894127 isoform X2 [Neoarius graeffei]|uniref:uncharacterized protein LOC132894127 isoform X2 n=1 Tax=Neoarius graeffei TaxID=443677 RepID=UPI00298C0FBD|nr:uncharacterized protein LOC132894127 isoform X2 [Neoarius graeffei]
MSLDDPCYPIMHRCLLHDVICVTVYWLQVNFNTSWNATLLWIGLLIDATFSFIPGHLTTTMTFPQKMAQLWNLVEFQDQSAAVVPLSWVVEVDGEVGCYWPPYSGQKAEKAAMNSIPPGQGWQFHPKIRVLTTCATFAKARSCLNRSLEEGCLTADLQSDGEMGPRKRHPNKRYFEEDSEEEAQPRRKGRRPPSIDATQLDSEWQFPSLNEDTQSASRHPASQFLHSQPLTHDSLPSETLPGLVLNSQPLTHASPLPLRQVNNQLLRDLPLSETPPGPLHHSQPLTHDSPQPHHRFHATPLPSQQGNNELLRDMGISTVISLLGQLREEIRELKGENREMKGMIGRLEQEVRAQRREMGRQDTPQTSPLTKLPLSTMEEFLAAEALVKEDAKQKQLMVSTLALCGGTDVGVTVRRMLRSLLDNSLASQFNWAGKGEKTAFKDTKMHDVLFGRLCMCTKL